MHWPVLCSGPHAHLLHLDFPHHPPQYLAQTPLGIWQTPKYLIRRLPAEQRCSSVMLPTVPAGSLALGTFALSQAQCSGCQQPPRILALAAARGVGRRQRLATACNDSPGGNSSPDVNYSPALPMPQASGCFVLGPVPQCLPPLQNLLSCCKHCLCPGAGSRALPCPQCVPGHR